VGKILIELALANHGRDPAALPGKRLTFLAKVRRTAAAAAAAAAPPPASGSLPPDPATSPFDAAEAKEAAKRREVGLYKLEFSLPIA
jgi:hypothetical protein